LLPPPSMPRKMATSVVLPQESAFTTDPAEARNRLDEMGTPEQIARPPRGKPATLKTVLSRWRLKYGAAVPAAVVGASAPRREGEMPWRQAAGRRRYVFGF
jgi:hypothetical protein